MFKLILPWLRPPAPARLARPLANPPADVVPAAARPVPQPPPGPWPIAVPPDRALFHVTHWKAASQWMLAILSDAFGPATVPSEYFQTQLLEHPIQLGKVYPCTYLTKHEYDALTVPGERRHFIIIRDLRDTLVSAYHSARYSHEVKTGFMAKWRWGLNRMDKEQGMLYMLETWLAWSGLVQRTWAEAGEPFYKVEDCLRDTPGFLARMFREDWGVTIQPELLRELAGRHSFAKLSGGRKSGEEDVKSHYRKGVAGDWREHFTPKITRRFKERFGEVLIMTGYEKDNSW